MSEEPVVDDRDRDEMLAELVAAAENYTDEWDPTSEDVGTTLFEIFLRFESDVVGRLNAVPEKHRVAFLDELGFDRRPPGTARVPLTVHTAGDVDRNVVVPGGTQAVAETDDAGSVVFEVPRNADFEATPATLEDVYGVDPATDRIVDHGRRLDRGESATLFTGADRQRHALYLGHGDLLNLAAGSTITVTILTNAVGEVLEDGLAWEYYGENEDGEEGWHRLERETDEVRDLSELDASLQGMIEQLRKRIREFTRGDPSEWGGNTFGLTFRLPGRTTGTPVDGVESRWIRAVAREGHPEDLGIEIESVAITVSRSAEGDGIVPETVLTNDVPLSVEDEEEFLPFGRMPQPPTTLYVDSEEALTKGGATVSLEFTPPALEEASGDGTDGDDREPSRDEDEDEDDAGDRRLSPTVDYGVLSGDPNVSWEYWNGNGWAKLDLGTDGTAALTEPGTVSFVVPPDLEATSVSGHEGHWIRARLVEGNYGQPRYEITDEGTRGELVEEPDPPRFGGLDIHYEQGGEPFEHVVTDNNLTYRHVPPGVETGSFAPFVEVPDDGQTLYLGFDDTLRDGPIPLYVPVRDANYPSRFDPEIRWEYCTDPRRDTWEKLDVRDGTEGLTERGIVSLSLPGETRAFERFGTTRHWIRARATGDQFRDRGSAGSATGDTDGSSRDPATSGRTDAARRRESGRPAPGASGSRSDSDDRVVDGEDDGRGPPTVAGIHPNTQWADNARTVEEETLGSSDGSPDQTFACANAPVTEIEVWVDESSAHPEPERRDLARRRPSDVRREGDRFWVRWTEVDNLLESGKDDRHYAIDRTAGRITLGDGQHGGVPPADEDNVAATYKTGGGSEGNVDAGAIESLKTPIALVDEVTNLEAGDGGADVETMATATTRATERLRTRDRAVSAADFEAVARAASRELAKVKCLTELDDRGERTPGWVTLLVVPRERRARPTPTVDLRGRVRSAVAERAPTAVGGDRDRIVVRGPRYAPVSVETRLSTAGDTSITRLKETVADELDAYLHPLTGGGGEGWEFGAAPRPTGIGGVLEAVDGIDSVEELAAWVEVGDERIRIPAGRPPSLPRDAMICAGTHEVTVTMTGERTGTAGNGVGTRPDRTGTTDDRRS
jgi:predicted phage baseplate assembly protein